MLFSSGRIRYKCHIKIKFGQLNTVIGRNPFTVAHFYSAEYIHFKYHFLYFGGIVSPQVQVFLKVK